MPRKIRTNKRRAAVKDFEAAWLAGDRKGDSCTASITPLCMKSCGTALAIMKTFTGRRGCSTLNPSN